MKKFKRLYKRTKEEFIRIRSIEFPQIMKAELYKGTPLSNMGFPVIILDNPKGMQPDLLTGGSSMPIVSEKVKHFIEASSEGLFCEFVPVRFSTENNDINSYFMLNILDPLSCFDFKNSIYKLANEDPRSLYDVKKMVIDESKTNNRKLFYMYEYPVEIFIEESFANEMIAFGIDNIRTLPLIGEK